MDKSPKKYRVSQIVNDLDDGDGCIPFYRISSYSKCIESLDIYPNNDDDDDDEVITKSVTAPF